MARPDKTETKTEEPKRRSKASLSMAELVVLNDKLSALESSDSVPGAVRFFLNSLSTPLRALMFQMEKNNIQELK